MAAQHSNYVQRSEILPVAEILNAPDTVKALRSDLRMPTWPFEQALWGASQLVFLTVEKPSQGNIGIECCLYVDLLVAALLIFPHSCKDHCLVKLRYYIHTKPSATDCQVHYSATLSCSLRSKKKDDAVPANTLKIMASHHSPLCTCLPSELTAKLGHPC